MQGVLLLGFVAMFVLLIGVATLIFWYMGKVVDSISKQKGEE